MCIRDRLQPDVYAVQGYDAGQLLAAGLEAVKGDVSKKAATVSYTHLTLPTSDLV